MLPIGYSVYPWQAFPAYPGTAITNGKEPRSCLGQVFNFKSGSFTNNTKIEDQANGHF
jgi:hypothetical protein